MELTEALNWSNKFS